MHEPDRGLARFRDTPAVLLTTYRRDGRPVPTPVSIAVDGDRAFVRTWRTAGKARRLRHTRRATIAPSTFRGRPTGEPTEVVARLVDGPDAHRAAELLRRKHPVLHGIVVPLVHRLTGKETVYLSLVPAA